MFKIRYKIYMLNNINICNLYIVCREYSLLLYKNICILSLKNYSIK